MKVTYNWLKDYVKIDLSSEELADKLTMAGLEVTRMEEVAGDRVMELEVTTNRPDWLSVVGVAREIGAITGRRIKYPGLAFSESDLETSGVARVKVEDPEACPRYTARVITDLKIKPSPKWLADRLTAVGIRPINLVVDITNFVLMELGQPLHAFDFERLAGGLIVVRRAKKGETLLTIDGTLVELSPDMLVIADARRPVALAGVMGGKDTEVNEHTRTILLESAYFDPVVTRKTARALGISTESSFRFERGVDLEGVLEASDRACHLLEELGQGKVSMGPIDVGKMEAKLSRIRLRPSWVNKVLGTDISRKVMEKVFRDLELGVISSKEDLMEVEPPSFRRDLTRPIDLVEEIARLCGYQNIPSTNPAMRAGKPHRDLGRKVESMAREIFSSCGLSEVITYSLIGRDSLRKAGLSQDEVISIQNPLSRDQAILRSHLLPGILGVVAWNKHRNVRDVKIFELGTIYYPEKGKLPREVKNLAIAISGRAPSDWRSKERSLDFYDLKGVVEALLARFGIADYEIKDMPHPSLQPMLSAALLIKGSQVGFLGEVSSEVLANFDIPDTVLVGELKLYEIIPHIRLERSFEPPPKYPSITLDLALIVKEDIPSNAITSIIWKVGAGLVRDVRLFDLYRGPQVPEGHKSLAYSIEYQALERTLTDEEAKATHSKICEGLKEKLSAQIR